ncbi:MAG: site-2 protease family protein [Paludibacteraceae bacterium]|nr:site-2 protease family protein [Paludibacteraceae bacterium]
MQWLQLILALSLLVVIHELGHFCFARLFKTRVEKFYMFFNPQFSIVRAKKINGKWKVKFFAPNVPASTVEVTDALGNVKKDKKDQPILRPMTDEELAALPEDDWRRYPDNTEWGLGWVPFGGYCAIAGMVDETKAATDLPTEPQPWEFRSKNVWQRLCIIIGGILVNFVAALLIFGMVLFHWGKDELPLSQINTGLYYSDLLIEEGFQQRDKVLQINGVEPSRLSDIVNAIILQGERDVLVLRGTDTVALTMSEDLGTRYLALQNDFDRDQREKSRADESYIKKSYVLVSYFMPLVIDTILPGGAASFANLQKGDSIVGVNGVGGLCQVQIANELAKYPCDSVTLDFYRAGVPMHARLFIGDQAMIGVNRVMPWDYYSVVHTDYTLLQAIPAGIQYGLDLLVMYVKQFRLVFTKEGAQSMGGFGAISNMFPDAWDWHSFWHMTAFLSLILAFMNFLPIPALDGGYILFLLWEIITRRKPSDKFLEIANTIGFWLLLALMIFANGNDIFKAFF